MSDRKSASGPELDSVINQLEGAGAPQRDKSLAEGVCELLNLELSASASQAPSVVYTSCEHPTYTEYWIGPGNIGRTCNHCGAQQILGKWTGGSIDALNANVKAARAERAATFEQHLEHVSQFLNDMYATMIDPCEQPKMKVSEMCEVLLQAARDNREVLNKQGYYIAELERTSAPAALIEKLEGLAKEWNVAGNDLMERSPYSAVTYNQCAFMLRGILRLAKQTMRSLGRMLSRNRGHKERR